MRLTKFILCVIPCICSCSTFTFAQDYTSYFTGNATDVVTQPYGGVCLMGGATEDDNAMIWFLQQANGGDVLVLRASGSDGYNDYFYTDLGVTVNSVETIVFNNAAASTSAYVQQKIEQAEAIWFAGGDQWNYISYWRNTPVDSLINIAVSERKIVVGGTSAGMAILGDVYFTAENGTVSSATALSNPYATAVTIDSASFIDVPYMSGVITDTHYDSPDRRGRHTVFLAKMFVDFGYEFPLGIACEEYVAICIDTLGIAHVYGGYPTYDEQAFFIQLNCEMNDMVLMPEVCSDGNPLTWSYGQAVLKVYKVNGTSTGANYFDLNNWENGSGGVWETWYVEAGTFDAVSSVQPDCSVSIEEHPTNAEFFVIYPRPTEFSIYIASATENSIEQIRIFDSAGKLQSEKSIGQKDTTISTIGFETGVYYLHCLVDGVWSSARFVVL